MKLGLHCSRFTWPGGPDAMGTTLASIARRLDEAGFYSLSVMDHFFQIPPVGPVDLDMNEAYTTLGFIAGVTERLRLGTIVTGVTYRHPGFLVKQVTTLDVLSGGRAWFGIGAAWFEREHLGLGIPFPPLSERFERLEETLQIAQLLWSGERTQYQGRHYQLAETLCSPLPLQRPHPPIVIGGGGERKTLRLVARYADACNLFANEGPEPVRHKLDVLRGHCETEGRDYNAIEKTVNSRLLVTRDGANGSETPAQAVARFRELAALGVTWASVGIPNAHEEGSLELIGREVIPALAEALIRKYVVTRTATGGNASRVTADSGVRSHLKAWEDGTVASPYRADHVGSLLRPPELLQARADHRERRIGTEQLREVEDATVLKALDLQRAAGISVFTEGEYRRPSWSAGIRDAIEGLAPDPGASLRLLGAWQGPSRELANAAMTGPVGAPPMVVGAKLRQIGRIAGAESAFLSRHAPGPWKITMPGPVSVAAQLFKPGLSEPFYPTQADLVAEIAGFQRAEIAALIGEGISYLQLDSLHYVERIADRTIRARMIAEGENPDATLDALIAADNSVLAGVRRDGLTVGLHMCRGNNRSAWHAEGGYEPIAEKAFNLLQVDRFLLEYDTDRAGGFEPLRFMPADKMVVLGLISSKDPTLESVDALHRRIDEAARYVPLERLAISPQCGFASTVLGNLLTWDEQRRKLELVAETARTVWG